LPGKLHFKSWGQKKTKEKEGARDEDKIQAARSPSHRLANKGPPPPTPHTPQQKSTMKAHQTNLRRKKKKGYLWGYQRASIGLGGTTPTGNIMKKNPSTSTSQRQRIASFIKPDNIQFDMKNGKRQHENSNAARWPIQTGFGKQGGSPPKSNRKAKKRKKNRGNSPANTKKKTRHSFQKTTRKRGNTIKRQKERTTPLGRDAPNQGRKRLTSLPLFDLSVSPPAQRQKTSSKETEGKNPSLVSPHTGQRE